jgi:hypothetical protein
MTATLCWRYADSYYLVDSSGEYFAAAYLLFKTVVIGSRLKLFAHGLKSLCKGDLEYGRYCTRQEVCTALLSLLNSTTIRGSISC